jgi:hypothetical protein
VRLERLLGTELPIIQAPMAGVQAGALAAAVCEAGAMGSLPCAMMTPEQMRAELELIRSRTRRPFNVNFFCHDPPPADAAGRAQWRELLAPYYAEFGIDPASVPAGAGRTPFGAEFADALEPYRPAVVSFHFGLPAADLVARVKSWGSKVLSSATTVEEALWLEAHGVDAVIAQGLEAGGTSRHVPGQRHLDAAWNVRPRSPGRERRAGPGDRRGRHRGCARRARGDGPRGCRCPGGNLVPALPEATTPKDQSRGPCGRGPTRPRSRISSRAAVARAS